MRYPTRRIIIAASVSIFTLAIGLRDVRAQQVDPGSSVDPITAMIQSSSGRQVKAENPHVRVQPRSSNGVSYSSDGQGTSGSLQERICRIADSLVGKRFKYAPGTKGGVMGCAQVVSTILKAAGAIRKISLSVLAVVSQLHSAGWRDTKAPPYRSGDVVTWATYSRSGRRGKKDPDTHIGVISIEGGAVYAINNSSSRLHPVKVLLSTYPYRVSRVVRSNA